MAIQLAIKLCGGKQSVKKNIPLISGVEQLNPPKPPVSEEPLEFGSFMFMACFFLFKLNPMRSGGDLNLICFERASAMVM